MTNVMLALAFSGLWFFTGYMTCLLVSERKAS